MSDKDIDYELYELEYGIRFDDDIDLPMPEPKPPNDDGDKHEEHQAGMGLYDWLQCIIVPVICGILIFIFIGRLIGVDGTSMLNTLQDNDVVVVSNLFYMPQYGDIVIIDSGASDEPYVKRVIATGGQTIDIDFGTGVVMIDGQPIVEDYIRGPTTTREDFQGPYTVPDGCVFVMGDNRNASKDSRNADVGAIDAREILGKVLFVLIPGKDEYNPRAWDRFGSVYR